MKVILNRDLAPLGEEGDVKDVAKGYARNFLFPRGIAFPYNERTVKLFESRREEIEARKVQKRSDAAGLREKLESLSLDITMPAGPNGKLYGAVTSQTIVDELAKQGYQIERKKVDVPGTHIKNVGKYKLMVKLYESASAEISINVIGQEIKTETTKAPPAKPFRRRREGTPSEGTTREGISHDEPSAVSAPESTPGETPAGAAESSKEPAADSPEQA